MVDFTRIDFDSDKVTPMTLAGSRDFDNGIQGKVFYVKHWDGIEESVTVTNDIGPMITIRFGNGFLQLVPIAKFCEMVIGRLTYTKSRMTSSPDRVHYHYRDLINERISLNVS